MSADPQVTRSIPTWLRDLSLLALVTTLGTFLFAHRLGFYSDDYAFLSVFRFSTDQSLIGLARSFVDANVETLARPGGILGFVILYELFGTNPLGYHVAILFVYFLGLCAFYFALRGFLGDRTVVLAVVAVYSILPHYSTDRLWYASFPALSSTLGS